MKKIQGRLFTDHLSHIADTLLHDEVKMVDDVKCLCTFNSTAAGLYYGNKDNMHRPYLQLSGHISSIAGNFPCDVGEITFGDNTVDNPGPDVTFQLEFNQDELAHLCKKGLFTKAFTCPDIFIDNEFTMPLSCKCKYIEPTDKSDVPLLFVDIKNQHNIQMNAFDTGYALADYFENVSQLIAEQTFDNDYLNLDSQDTLYGRDSDDFLFNDVAGKDNKKSEDRSVKVTTGSILKQSTPVTQSIKDADLKAHFENIRREVNNKLVDRSALVASESRQTLTNNRQQSAVYDFEDRVVNTNQAENNTQAVESDFNDSVDEYFNDSMDDSYDGLQDEIVDDSDELFEDEKDNRRNAVAINQAENFDGIRFDKRTIPSHMTDIAEKDGSLSDDVYDGEESEFI